MPLFNSEMFFWIKFRFDKTFSDIILYELKMNERSASNSLQKENRSKKLSSQNDESKDNDANTDSIALRRSKRISK